MAIISLPTTIVAAILFVLTCISIILGAVAWSRSISFFLPFPPSLSASGTLLPIFTILLLLTTNVLLSRRSTRADTRRKRITNTNNSNAPDGNTNDINNGRSEPSPTTATSTILTFIIDQLLTLAPAIVATLAATYVAPPISSFSSSPNNNIINTCHLEQTWQSYYRAKNADAIRTIQDRLNCCGLRSTHDRAWPFKDASHGDDACVVQLGYQQSCLQPWREVEQNTAWMVFCAAALCWAVKMGLTHLTPRARDGPYGYGGGGSGVRNWPANNSSSVPRMLPRYSDNPNDNDEGDEETGGRDGTNNRNRQGGRSNGADAHGRTHANIPDNNNQTGPRGFSESSPWGGEAD